MASIPSEKERGKGVPFERIRRITGYLTGTIDSWNNAKKSELFDRVAHETIIKKDTV